MLEERLSSFQDSVSLKNQPDDDGISVGSGLSSFYNYQNLKKKSFAKRRNRESSQKIMVADMEQRLPSERKRSYCKASNIMPSQRSGAIGIPIVNNAAEIPEEAEGTSRRNSLITFFTSNEERRKITQFYQQFEKTMKDKDKTKQLLDDTIKQQRTESRPTLEPG